ncbi:MAG: nucleotidyltransferase [Flavobacteriales bacterium CG_4_10_14_0_2_um_filter_32_8]|nr:MAG: nucleotidyltransferase [Flavobacteriales bacterium CG_4_10_14_0_2_um_filter_32_8]PJB14561.1 MAG: nucleotidyltransferase [Flavobacteriales bacterium CG_4_9_14_3_um_filter_32_8]
MKIIVPMAGRGSRLRPHTLTIPKPLLPIAGKSIVQRLVEDITKVCGEPVDEIAFIIGDFGAQVEKDLITVAESLGAKGSIYYQEKALGTAHAILCAKDSLQGKVVVAFADTLFRADFTLDNNAEGIIWVNKIDDPSAFGVVKVNADNVITDFVEKPKEYVSDLAIIGIYYFKDGNYLKHELQYLIDNDIKGGGEYQLTDALENMKQKGTKFVPGKVDEWLDCGNYKATVYTNQRVLEFIKEEKLIDSSLKKENTVIIEPCYIDKNVEITNSIIGPHVSIGENTVIKNSIISNTIIQTNSLIRSSNFKNSMVGNYANIKGIVQELSVGDYNEIY